MAVSIALIGLTVIAFVLIAFTKIKLEYIFILLLMSFSVFSDIESFGIEANALYCLLALCLFVLIKLINVNIIIKHSFSIYILTLVLLAVALFLPGYDNAHRYVYIGPVVLIPSELVVFSILPVATLINNMKRITFNRLLIVIVFASIELFLVLIQPNIRPVIVMCIVFLIMLIKGKLEKRIHVSWFTVISINAAFVLGWILLLLTPYMSAHIKQLIDVVLSRGASDPEGYGYQLQIVDTVISRVKVFGPADLSDVWGRTSSIIRGMPFLCFMAKCGWVCAILFILATILLIVRLYLMSSKIKNSFARYVTFGIATYFTVGCLFHLFAEFIIGNNADHFLFMGGLTGIIANAILIAIAFSLYKQRNKITIGRQLDIDYDMTDEVLKDYADAYRNELNNADNSLTEIKQLRARIKELEAERNKWKKGSKTLLEINKNFEKYEDELHSKASKKDLVFISYNHFDEKHAAYLATRIEARGLSAWHFKRDMKSESGTNDYSIAIRKAIRRARVFVVILSNHSMTSEHVKNEVCLAFNQLTKGTIMMPIIIDKVSIYDDETLGYYLCRQDISEALTPPIKKQLDKFAQKIEIAYK